MIIFDYEKYIKRIKKDGVSATDINAKKKIDDILMDMICNSTYKKGVIIRKVIDIADDYYKGCPDDVIFHEIQDAYNENLARARFIDIKAEKKILTLYKSEMDTIINLPDEKLQRLAFASLVAFKYYSYHHVLDDNIDSPISYRKTVYQDLTADIYELAQFDSVSGKVRNKLQKELTDLGLIKYWCFFNSSYKYTQDNIAQLTMTVPFCVEVNGTQDTEEVYMRMTNYDDIMLYLRYYKGDEEVTTCDCCGTPILKSGNAKRLCSDCAEISKKASDKARYAIKAAV